MIVELEELYRERGKSNFHEDIDSVACAYYSKPYHPKLVSMGSKPLTILVMVFVFKSHSDSVVLVAPQLFHKLIVELLVPFSGQKLSNRFSPFEKLELKSKVMIR